MTPPAPDTRERLLACARQLFSERGYAATSTREIAAAAGCNISLIAHYFGGKEGLLHALLHREIEGPRIQIGQVLASPLPLAQRLTGFVAYLLGKFSRDHEMLAIFHREVINGGDDAARADFIAFVRERVGELAAVFEDARRRGEIRADLDPRLCCVLLQGMVQFYFLNYRVAKHLIGEPTTELLGELHRHIVSIFLHGVTPQPGSPT